MCFNIYVMLIIWLEMDSADCRLFFFFFFFKCVTFRTNWKVIKTDILLFFHLLPDILLEERHTGNIWRDSFVLQPFFPLFSQFSCRQDWKIHVGIKPKNSSWAQHVVWTWHLDLPRTKLLPQVLRLVIFSGKGGSTCFNRWKYHQGQTYFPQLCCR